MLQNNFLAYLYKKILDMLVKYLLKINCALLSILFLLANINCGAQNLDNKNWKDKKFSMFVHWGLYSQLGGVWDNKPVEWGYSEQIQSFAGIFGDYYAATANDFKAEKWSADSIVSLAKRAGMSSVVFTSKHHDGFSMYKTKFSDYNIVDATPFGRDPLKELSESCKKYGLNLGIYFSLIDWHFPQAYPISSHNADPITPEHHLHNLKQVRELLTNYGSISELWFDMGSLTREQSKEMYELVKHLQPNCMVSGRIGNDYGDFAVMADNQYPNYKIETPWQTAASVYKETWGYRSWQKHVPLEEKLAEKITSLKKVLAHGGNYLLNIGPMGDGQIVEYEKDLLLAIGSYLNNLPDNLSLWAQQSSVNLQKPKLNKQLLTLEDAEIIYNYSSFDYYSSFKNIAAYQWNLDSINLKQGKYKILLNCGDLDKNLRINYREPYLIDTKKVDGLLKEKEAEKLLKTKILKAANIQLNYNFILRKGRSAFNEVFIDTNAQKAVSSIYTKTDLAVAEQAGWRLIKSANENLFSFTEPIKWKSNRWFAHTIVAAESGKLLVEIGTADAIEIHLNGKSILKRAFTKSYPTKEIVCLNLNKGNNTLIVKMHNRFNSKIDYSINVNIPQKYYLLKL